MKRILIYSAALVLGCVFAIGLSEDDWRYPAARAIESEPRPQSTEPRIPHTNPSMEMLTARVEAMQDALTGVQGRVQALERARDEAMAARAAEPSAALAPNVPHSAGQDPLPDNEDDPEARYREMQDLLARQEPDPAWEVMAASDVATRFEAAAPAGTVLENVACVGRMCRLDLHHDAGASLDDLLLTDAVASWPHRGVAHALDAERSVLFLVSEER